MQRKLLDIMCGEKGAERRISAIAAAILALTVLAGGAAIFSVLAHHLDAELENGLVRTLNDKAALFQGEINAVAEIAEGVASRRLHLRKLMLAVNSGAAGEDDLHEIGAILDSIKLDHKLSVIGLYDARGRLVAGRGEFLREPFAATLLHPENTALLWKGRYYLGATARMQENGTTIGTVKLEYPLPGITSAFQDYRGLGETGEIALCAALAGEQMRCFPTRHRPEVFEIQRSIDGVPLPMSAALDGKSGVVTALDYRQSEVLDAYQPVGDSGLGMVVKIETAELEQPIRKHLLWIAPFLAALLTLGFALLRWQMGASVREVVSSRARVRGILDNSADGIITIDEQGMVESFNFAAARIFGYPAFEVIGSNVNLLMPEPYRSRHDEGIRNYLRSGEAKVIGRGAREVQGQRRDGSVFPMDLTLGEMVLGGRRLFIASVRDTSALKQAHDELQSGFVALQAANRELEEVHARLRQAELDKDLQMDALAEANVRMVLFHATMEQVRQAESTFTECGNGETFCRSILTDAMTLTGAKYGAIGLFDASGRLQQFLTEGIPEEEREKIGPYPAGKGLLHAFYRENKMACVDRIADDPRSCGFPPNHPPMKSLLGVPLVVNSVTKGVIYLADKHGGEPFTAQDEMLMEMLAREVEHVLERNELLASLRESNQALTREREEQQGLIAKLQEAQHQLLQSEKMASIGQLAAGVAHEINNPIGYVYSNLGSLEKYLDDLFAALAAYEKVEAELDGSKEAVGALQKMKRALDLDFLKQDIPALMGESKEGITRVKKIVQDLKDFSHADAGDEWQWADLHHGLDSTLNVAWNEIKYKAEVVKEYGDLPNIECLPSQLNQVFMNLLVNAAHAIEERGTITIRTGRENDEVWVEIADSGKGIEPENLSRIFDPFFTTKPVGKGTGLGLSLSYSIVKKHHGKIEVESEPGRGTTFRVLLPVNQPEKLE